MRLGKLKKWTVEELKIAVAESINYSQVTRKLGLGHISTNFKTIKKYINHFKIDTSHFNDSAQRNARLQYLRNITISNEQIFTANSTFTGSTVRKKYLPLVPYRCVDCGNDGTHNGRSLTLQVDHINGNPRDNRLLNLRLLCPNCHSQTITFGAKKRSISDETKKRRSSKERTRVKGKRDYKTKIDWPPVDALLELATQHGYEQTGRILNVSGAAVKKRLKKHDMALPLYHFQTSLISVC